MVVPIVLAVAVNDAVVGVAAVVGVRQWLAIIGVVVVVSFYWLSVMQLSAL